jgi:hypothetical protein
LSADGFFVSVVEQPFQPDWHRTATSQRPALAKHQNASQAVAGNFKLNNEMYTFNSRTMDKDPQAVSNPSNLE